MNNPFVTKFAAQVGDIVVTNCDTSKTLQLLKGSQLILKETYNYDTDRQIRIGGLADVIMQAVYGDLKVGVQTAAKAAFTVKLTDEEDITATIYAMRLQNPRDPRGLKAVLAAAPRGVCHPGTQQLVTVIGTVVVGLVGTNHTTTIGTAGEVETVDCDPAVLFANHYEQGMALNIGNELLLDIVAPVCEDQVEVRFLNRYDMPQSLVAQYMEEKPQAQDDTAMMRGQRTRFDVKSTTEYTLHSGPLHDSSETDSWQDLLMARKAQVRVHGQWHDIVVTKSNITRQRLRFHGPKIDITFQTANPLMLL